MSDICWGLTEKYSMVNPKLSNCPKICYRPIRPSDLDVLERIHGKLFPIRYGLSWCCFVVSEFFILYHYRFCQFFRYESAFFQDVVNGHDIVSWGAVDRSLPDGQSDEIIGFVTARVVLAKESEVGPLQVQVCAFCLITWHIL